MNEIWNHIETLRLRQQGMEIIEAVCNLLRLKNKNKFAGFTYFQVSYPAGGGCKAIILKTAKGGAVVVRPVSLTYKLCLEKPAPKLWALRPCFK